MTLSTVRGADFSFYSYQRLPVDECPVGYPEKPPELVIEVLWQDDRWTTVLTKTAEFLSVGVSSVIILNPEFGSAHVFAADDPVRILDKTDRLELPDILPEFSVSVEKLFRRE